MEKYNTNYFKIRLEYMKKFITSILSAGVDTISSKRVCGILGFLVIVFIIIYCTINVIQAPAMIDSFVYATCMLLGIDSVTSIWKK